MSLFTELYLMCLLGESFDIVLVGFMLGWVYGHEDPFRPYKRSHQYHHTTWWDHRNWGVSSALYRRYTIQSVYSSSWGLLAQINEQVLFIFVAALHLGCTPRRASRSQRNINPRCYLSQDSTNLDNILSQVFMKPNNFVPKNVAEAQEKRVEKCPVSKYSAYPLCYSFRPISDSCKSKNSRPASVKDATNGNTFGGCECDLSLRLGPSKPTQKRSKISSNNNNSWKGGQDWVLCYKNGWLVRSFSLLSRSRCLWTCK